MDPGERFRPAVELAKRDNGKLVIAHVEEDIIGKGGGPIQATEDEIQAEIRRHGRRALHAGHRDECRDAAA